MRLSISLVALVFAATAVSGVPIIGRAEGALWKSGAHQVVSDEPATDKIAARAEGALWKSGAHQTVSDSEAKE
ncbi:hypothetical protein C8Q76DRAFT_856147 [Earliella scabrosa]|nr:hypothetical protein C8Q76DRAFT_856147 [Earliella scabrosa]